MPKFVKSDTGSSLDYDQDRCRLTFEVVQGDFIPSSRPESTPSSYVTIEALNLSKEYTLSTLKSDEKEFKQVEHLFRTQVCKNTKSPSWKKRFAIFPKDEKEILRISVFDKGIISGDILVASVDLPLETLDLVYRSDMDIWVTMKVIVKSDEERDPEIRLVLSPENFAIDAPSRSYKKNQDLIEFANELLDAVRDERYHFVKQSIDMLEKKIELYMLDPKPRNENILASFMRGYLESIEVEGVKFQTKEKCKNLFSS